MLKIHHIRNATLVIEVDENIILIDPLLGNKGSMPSYTKQFNPQKNPIIDLPENADELLDRVTHCLITHQHSDHLDKAGEKFLIKKDIPVTCSKLDAKHLKSKGLNIKQSLNYWKSEPFLNGSIQGIPAQHGYDEAIELMGNVMGFFIKLPNDKTIYLSSDTVFTKDVEYVLRQYKPEISVLACGSAQLDEYEPILMKMDDILKFISIAPGTVMANHLEAINHCPTSRKKLKQELQESGLFDKTWIPNDGESKLF
jgi:L-ascorbate metabolism protein UlaG (beta-lactamase superfamily)